MLQSESLRDKFLKRGFWLYLFSLFIGPFGYIAKLITGNTLSIEEFGLLYSIIGLITLISGYNDLGFTESLNYFLPKTIIANDWIKTKLLFLYAFVAQMGSSILIGGFFLFGADWLSIHYFHDPLAAPILKIFSLFFLGLNLFTLINTFFRAIQNTKLQKWTEFLRMASVALVIALLAILGKWNLINYSWAWNVGVLIGLVVSWVIFYHTLYRPHLRGIHTPSIPSFRSEVLHYSLWALFASNIALFLSQIDLQLVQYILGAKQAGFYSCYISLISMPFYVVSPLMGFVFPVISELSAKSHHSTIEKIRSNIMNLFSAAGMTSSAFLFVFWPLLAEVLFGWSFSAAGFILRFSSLFITFNLLLQINFQILSGTGHVKKRLQVLWYGLIANLCLTLLLIHGGRIGLFSWTGTEGVSFAVGMAWIVIFWLSHRATREYKTNLDWRSLIINGISLLLLSCLYWQFLPYLQTLTRVEKWIGLTIAAFFMLLVSIMLNYKQWKNLLGKKNILPTQIENFEPL